MKTLIMLVMGLFMLTACFAPSTMRGLRQDHAATHAFTVAKPYATVYRVLLEHARTCHEWHPWYTGVDVEVAGDLWPDLQRGEVRVLQVTWNARQLMLGVDVAALDADHTTATAYAGRWSTVEWLPVVERWVVEGSEACK